MKTWKRPDAAAFFKIFGGQCFRLRGRHRKFQSKALLPRSRVISRSLRGPGISGIVTAMGINTKPARLSAVANYGASAQGSVKIGSPRKSRDVRHFPSEPRTGKRYVRWPTASQLMRKQTILDFHQG
jgi:hypothetical protein